MFIGEATHRQSEIPTSSLADIVFLLLIFFLVTTNIELEKGIGLALPPWESKIQPIPNMSSVLINSSNQIAFDGQPIQLDQLKGTIRNILNTKPDYVISLKTDINTNYEMYIKVLDKIKQAWGSKPARISIAEPYR